MTPSIHASTGEWPLTLNLLTKDTLEGDGIRCKLRDTFPQFLNSHSFFIEIESEQRFVLEVGFLRNIKARRIARDQLLWYVLFRVVQFLEQVGLARFSNRFVSMETQCPPTEIVR